MIQFTCGHCGRVIRVALQHAGKRAKCPSCQQVITIPVQKMEADDLILLQADDSPARPRTAEPRPAMPPRNGPVEGDSAMPARKRLILAGAGGVLLLAAIAVGIWWWSGHHGAAGTGQGADGGSASPSDLPVLANGMYDPAGCQVVMNILHGIHLKGWPVAVSPDAQKLVYGPRGAIAPAGRPLGLWAPPAEPNDRPNQLAVGCDGGEGGNGERAIIFSPDSKHTAYIGVVKDQKPGEYDVPDRFVIVRDGVPSGPYCKVTHLEFSPDSQRLGAIVEVKRDSGRMQQVIVDGKPGKDYYQIEAGAVNLWRNVGKRGLFSPDSKRIAYQVMLQWADAGAWKQWAIVVDGNETPSFGRPLSSTWSPDSRHIAFAAWTDKGMVLVQDGAKVGEHPSIVSYSLKFSPDSGTLAYIAGDKPIGWGDFSPSNGTKYRAVVGQRAYKQHDYMCIDSLSIDNNGVPRYTVIEGQIGPDSKAFLVEGETQTPHQMIMTFPSADGAHYVTVTRSDIRRDGPGVVPQMKPSFTLQLDKREPIKVDGGPVLSVDPKQGYFVPRLSPDGRHVAMLLTDWSGINKKLAIDGVVGPNFEDNIVGACYAAPHRVVLMLQYQDVIRVVEFRVVKK